MELLDDQILLKAPVQCQSGCHSVLRNMGNTTVDIEDRRLIDHFFSFKKELSAIRFSKTCQNFT